jgi:hypothetical protein
MQITEDINAGAALANARGTGGLRTIERLLGSLVGIVAAALVVTASNDAMPMPAGSDW